MDIFFPFLNLLAIILVCKLNEFGDVRLKIKIAVYVSQNWKDH